MSLDLDRLVNTSFDGTEEERPQLDFEAAEDTKVSLDPELYALRDRVRDQEIELNKIDYYLNIPALAEYPDRVSKVKALQLSAESQFEQLKISIPVKDDELRTTLLNVLAELYRAQNLNPPMLSAHDGFGVLREEFDETWQHVCTNPKRLNHDEFHEEAVQLAAMAIRFLHDIVVPGRQKKARE